MTARLKPRLGSAARAAALVVLVAACRAAPVEPCPSTRAAGMAAEQAALVARPSPFDSTFQAAGAEFDVPPALLKAIGWVETRWQMVQGAEEFPGRAPVFGVMALRGAALERGAALAGVTPDAARRDPVANIRAAAALLRAYAAEAGGDWDAAAARFSGIDLPAGRVAYTRAITRAQGGAGPAAAAGRAPSALDAPDPTSFRTLQDYKDEAERIFILRKLKENRWNISRTARAIDTPRSNLYKKLEQYGISRDQVQE